MAFPTFYIAADKRLWRIVNRIPYVLFGEIATIAPSTAAVAFPPAAFMHGVEAPFEIHDIVPRAYALTNGQPVADIVPDMNAWWRLTISATQLGDFRCTRAATRVDNLVDRLTRNWQIAGPDASRPVYLEKSQGFSLAADNLHTVSNIYVSVAFRGYVVSLEPEEARKG